MSDFIKKFDPSQEYYFEEGCHIIETSNSAADEEVSIVRARVAPGQQTRWHRLENTTERYVILEGTGLVEVGTQKPGEVAAGDVVIIPPNTRQRINNSGATDLLFLAICTPRFQRENYHECPA
ncbi:MAG: cupin domain-containing protein [Pseudohongiellaceae bacterium]